MSSDPPSSPRTSSKPSSTHRARRLRYRMTGPSLPSSSSCSRSGQCPTGPQASAKPTLWALWVRTHTTLLPFPIPLFHTHLTLALGSLVGTESPEDQKARGIRKKEELKMICLSCGIGLSLPGNQKPSQQTVFAEGKRYAGRCGRRPNERTVCSLRHHGLPPKLGGKAVREVGTLQGVRLNKALLLTLSSPQWPGSH